VFILIILDLLATSKKGKLFWLYYDIRRILHNTHILYPEVGCYKYTILQQLSFKPNRSTTTCLLALIISLINSWNATVI